jgi:tetratricopeptide (TPR) repeat protein
MAAKAGIYQAEGNLQEAARFLSEINGQTAHEDTFQIKVTQLRLERDYGEAVRLLQARLAQFRFTSSNAKGGDELALAFIQRLAGDTVGAKVAAKEACNTFEPVYRDQPDNAVIAASLALAYAAMGEKDSALKTGERAIMLLCRPNAAMGPTLKGTWRSFINLR